MNAVVSCPHPHAHFGGDSVTGRERIRRHKAALCKDWMLCRCSDFDPAIELDLVQVIGDASSPRGHRGSDVAYQYDISYTHSLDRRRPAVKQDCPVLKAERA